MFEIKITLKDLKSSIISFSTLDFKKAFDFQISNKGYSLKEQSLCKKSDFILRNLMLQLPLIFQTLNSKILKILSLKYQMFTPLGCEDIGIRFCGKDSSPFQGYISQHLV